MTTLVDVREAVYARFDTLWTSTPFVFDNVDTNLDEGESAWARLVVRELGGGQDTLGVSGNRKYRRVFSIFLQIFTPTNDGMKQAGQLAEEARSIFEGVSFGDLDMNDVSIRDLPPEDKWNKTLVEADGRFYQTK